MAAEFKFGFLGVGADTREPQLNLIVDPSKWQITLATAWPAGWTGTCY